MRVLPFALTVTGAAAAAVLLGSGNASAADPVTTDNGIGLWFTPAETASVANSPIPDAIDALVPPANHRVYMEEGSVLAYPDGSTNASDKAIIGEAAAHPGGTAAIVLTNPLSPIDPGSVVEIYQIW
ncbi:hypothetical protein JK358_13450 [Nocardia sp. 2]|uniref:Uncharacterized protein n=1 Tax=Nocardia acididurans TaxID=2802282 RepID=A0ABS1M4B9_9NOCA|nr:hypothetical protein [Nocardia acididurans]MBL1075401.1 hypothetical protein [Nocardia acididurans]